MRLEHLENRVVLSSLPSAELLAPFCTPLDAGSVVSIGPSVSAANGPVYGPLPDTSLASFKLAGPEDASVRKPVSAIDRLQMPGMPGLSGLNSNIAGAIAEAWDIPVDSMTHAWAVGLAAGQGPGDLQQLGFETAVQAPYLPNVFILEFAEPTRVAGLTDQLSALNAVEYFYPLIARQQVSRLIPNDPLFPGQWHLQNTAQSGGTVGEDANIVSAWDTYTGDGVVIGIVDDGLQHTHVDLVGNYDAALSHDFYDNDADPTPAANDYHGTQMAGIAAAVGNNALGVSGTAPNATLAGLRLTGGPTTDLMEASSLSYENQSIDIYSSSWGSDDFGVLSGPGPLTLAALESGVTSGRGGLGNIYVWAAGNGLANDDNVNYDGYANSRYTIAVSAVDHDGGQSVYSEPGAPILVSAFSSNFLTATSGFAGITTTTLTGTGDVDDPPGSPDYTTEAVGTSSSASLVSGVVALMLEANPNLTWRDVQHILVNSASQNDASDSDWTTNGGAHLVNHKYGFGAIDAQAAVNLATSWTNVAPEASASTGLLTVGADIPDDDPTGVTSTVFVPEAIKIEQVEVVLNATHTYRGDLRVVLTSPAGTESVLAETHGDNGDNYSSWVFTTVRNWDELSYGEWTLTISDGFNFDVGTFDSWQLNFYGTASDGEDFGDAPDVPYGTVTTSDGARHLIGGRNLGATVDQEADGQPSADASGDGADEDGIVFIDPLVAGETAYIQVTSTPGGGVLDYFFDFDGAGGFGNHANEVFSSILSGGTEIIGVDVPVSAVAGPTFARFRLSGNGNLGPLGAASDGEVEDYFVNVFSEAPPRDFGDAPGALYATLSADGGPSHLIGGPLLGSAVDAEANGQPNAVATGDGADEDGVHFVELLMVGQTAQVEVTSSPGGGVLDFFVDFNGNGQYGDDPAEVFQAALNGGTETIQVLVPGNAVAGITFARFRISSGGNLGPLALAQDGEVEDYQLLILPAPTSNCSELAYFDNVAAPNLPAGWSNVSTGENWATVGSGSDTAPNHVFVADSDTYSENRLTSPQVDIVGGIDRLQFRNYYNMEANWDGGVLEISIGGGARQDIVVAGGTFVAGGYNDVLFGGSPLGTRSVWTGDSGGYVDTIVDLPPDAAGQTVQFHWIEGTDTSALWEGWHIDTIQLCSSVELAYDFGDAPDPTYPTLSASGGAAHVVGGSLYLGASIDIDADGQQSLDGTGDDADAGGNDEDGVTFTSALVPGATATVDVVASESGLLSAWIDFNADGDWSDPGEEVFQDLWLTNGTNSLSFQVPGDAVAGDSFARFRLSTQSGLAFTGLAPDGEVEDHAVVIGEAVPPVVESVVVGDGTTARSMVSQVVVTFDQLMVLDAGVFSVMQRGAAGGPVDVAFSTAEVGGKTVATLTFSGALTLNGSLMDGNYDLTIDATKARGAGDLALDGDGDGLAGGDYMFGAEEADAFFRLFGDLDGSRFVGNNDYAAFRSAFRKTPGEDGYDPQFDSDNSAFIGNNDYALFRLHFRTGLAFE